MDNNYPVIPWESEEIKKIRAQCQKPTAIEEPFARYFLRRISIYFTILFNKLGLTPNFVSCLSLFFFFLSGLVIIESGPIALTLAFVCYTLGYLFDCVDGEMARLRNITSKRGAFLDNLIRGNTVVITVGIIISIAYMMNTVELAVGSLLYVGFVLAFLSLQIPIAFEITFVNKEKEDPVYQLRKKTLFDQIAFWTGVPGFFTVLVFFIPINVFFTGSQLYLYFLFLFLFLTFLKASLRGILTFMKM